MKPLLILFCAATVLAQSPNDKTFTIPDFKVTEQSLAKALPARQSMFVYPPELRNGPIRVTVKTPEPMCLTMHSYRFDMSAAPKLVSETNCTMVSKNGFLRVQR